MAVITYSYSSDGSTTISWHFKIREFASIKDGQLTTDIIKIDDSLPMKIEYLMGYIGARTGYITSGYRDPVWDAQLGGGKTGQHSLGKAVDIYFKDVYGNKIDPKLVCCAAQDMGWKGIGYMTGATHLDVRDTKSWFDETSGNALVGDWYSYLGVSTTQPSFLTIADSVKIQRYLAGMETLSPLMRYDFDYNNVVNVGDSVICLRILADKA